MLEVRANKGEIEATMKGDTSEIMTELVLISDSVINRLSSNVNNSHLLDMFIDTLKHFSKDNLDWNKFKRRDILVKVTKDNWKNFANEAQSHRIGGFDGLDIFEDEGFKAFRCILRPQLHDDEVYIVCEDGQLKLSFHTEKDKEVYVW